jgi:hypothetical protein
MYVPARVPRYGEFLPVGWLFSLGSFLEKFKSDSIYLATFFHGTSSVLILKKMGWATFWAIFPLSHLVTLLLAAALSVMLSAEFRNGSIRHPRHFLRLF